MRKDSIQLAVKLHRFVFLDASKKEVHGTKIDRNEEVLVELRIL